MFTIVLKRRAIYALAALVSLLLSWIITKHTKVINPDAVCYLLSAESLPQHLNYAMHLCGQAKWPFYSLCIAFLHQTLGLSLEQAAYGLNAIFSCFAVLIFMAIIDFLSYKKSNPLLLYLAAFTILSANIFNNVRHYIIRDHGFWAFYLLALFFLCVYLRRRHIIYALCWSGASIIATLFRIEGVIFLLCIPWIMWFETNKPFPQRLQAFLYLNILTLLSLFILSILCLYFPAESLGRLQELNFKHAFLFFKTFMLKAEFLAENFLNIHAHEAQIVLLFTLIAWYLYSLLQNISLGYALTIGYGWKKQTFTPGGMTRTILLSYVALYVILTFLFLIENMFISKRYLVGLSLTLMLWVPFTLHYLIRHFQKHRIISSVLFLCIAYSTVGGLVSLGASKNYIRKAGEWLDQYAPMHASIYSNDLLVMYYSQRFGHDIFKKEEAFKALNQHWLEYDYLALRITHSRQALSPVVLKSIGFNPIVSFKNERGDDVVIFKKKNGCYPC